MLAEPGKHEARTGTPRRLAYVCVFDPDRLRHGGGQLRTQHGRTIARRCVDHYALPIGPDNPHGKTMGRRETLLRTELAAQRDIDLPAARRWRISNPGRRNRIGVPVAYELVPGANALPFAHPDSPIGRRAGFMYHHLWVTQSLGDPIRAGRAACRRLVPEPGCRRELPSGLDRPGPRYTVQPVVRIGFELVPFGFFDRNPALNLPPAAPACREWGRPPYRRARRRAILRCRGRPASCVATRSGNPTMPLFITQGRYSREAISGMIAMPEDRSATAAKLIEAAGGKMLAYYITFGEYDWLIVADLPSEKHAAAYIVKAASTGGVTDTKTMAAMTTADAEAAYTMAAGIGTYRAPGAA
jgi:uncharacterized protein with GYD domain